jgi:uncharacterized protein YjbK
MRMGLRIRVLADRGELTLKVPAPEGLLEINDPLSLVFNEPIKWIEAISIPNSCNFFATAPSVGR